MKKEFIKIYEEFNSYVAEGMEIDIDVFFEDNKKVQEYIVEINDKTEILIKIKLHEYSTILAKELFLEFVNFVGYRYADFFIRDVLQQKTICLYITAMDDFKGTKMKITIE